MFVSLQACLWIGIEKKKRMKSLKFRRNVCQIWHFGRKNEAQERAILWKNMQDLLCTVNSAGVK